MSVAVEAWVLNEEGPLERVMIAGLEDMQHCVRGNIEGLRVPEQDERSVKGGILTCYGNEEGKHDPTCKPNMAATDYMMRVLQPGDYISGPLLLVGLNLNTGESMSVPQELPAFLKLVLNEAGRLPVKDRTKE